MMKVVKPRYLVYGHPSHSGNPHNGYKNPCVNGLMTIPQYGDRAQLVTVVGRVFHGYPIHIPLNLHVFWLNSYTNPYKSIQYIHISPYRSNITKSPYRSVYIPSGTLT